jgi:hypothetical protein
MKSYALLTTLLAFCLMMPDCRKQDTPRPLTPEKATKIRQVIVDYLECEECTHGELNAVVKLGPVAVPTLAATLREGPSPANLEVLRRRLTASYRELKEYERTHPKAKMPGSEEQFVKTYTDNYVAVNQARAAAALGTIGGSEARRALEEASRTSLRDDVKAVVKSSLEKIK